jgi:hypothetical protein
MRILALTTLGTMLAAVPVGAQTYDPNFPVCLQVFGIGGNYIACGYTSMAQCAQSASGRGAMLGQPIFRGCKCAYQPNIRAATPQWRLNVG